MKLNKKITFCILTLLLFFSVSYLYSFQKIIKISGDNQLGIKNYPLRDDFCVKVEEDGKPSQNIPVSFVILSKKDKLSDMEVTSSRLSSPVVVTDSNGVAKTRINLGNESLSEIIVSASTRKTIGNPVVFKVIVKNRNWLFYLFLGVIGGLGLFLFGAYYLNENLKKLAGQKLRDFLITMAGSPVRGIFTGFFCNDAQSGKFCNNNIRSKPC